MKLHLILKPLLAVAVSALLLTSCIIVPDGPHGRIHVGSYPGSYHQTCQRCHRRGYRLRCRCLTRRQRLRWTSLRNPQACPWIVNRNGHLRCRG